MSRRVVRFFAPLVMLAALAAGCNVYEGLYEDGESDDPAVLLEDARIALQKDRPDQAVQHLRRALDNTQADTPLRKRVQIKLASAVLLAQGIDALSFSRLARNFSGASRQQAGAGKAQSQTCNFPAHHGREAFDPRQGIDFARLGSAAGAEALAESQALVIRVFSGEEDKSEYTFPCDAAALDAAVEALREQGLSKEEIAEALVDYAVAVSTTAYLDVLSAGGDQALFFYATPPAGGDYLGICFPDEATCLNTTARMQGNLSRFDCATRVLQKRAALLESTAARELADLGRDSYLSLEAGLQDAVCLTY